MATHNEQPTFFVYDKYPGGIGLSEKVYDLWEGLLTKTLEHVSGCTCESGCPSCIGVQNSLEQAKKKVIELLRILN